MANRLDIVAVGIEDEGSIVIGMVVWAHPGPSVVSAAGRDRLIMKPVDRGAIRSRKGNMGACLGCIAPTDPEEGLWADAIACEPFPFAYKRVIPSGPSARS